MPIRIPKRSPLSKALGLDVKAGHKFNAKRTTVDGITFDSQKEAHHYAELALRVKLGEIDQLQLQPVFPLLAPRDGGGYARVGEYRADFEYRVVQNGARVVVDCKGMRTALYRWKKKHVEIEYGIQILEV